MQLADDRDAGLIDRLGRALSTGTLVLLLLLIGELMLSARAVELANWDDDFVSLWPLAAGGVMLGFIVSRTRMPDLLAHLAGLFTGLALALIYATRYLNAPEESLGGKVRLLVDLIATWLRESLGGRQAREDLVLISAMGLLLWLIGYMSAWFLFRRGWLLPAVFLPGIPIALNLGSIDQGMGAALLIYVLLALCLAAVQVARLRTAHWQRAGLAFSTIAWRAPAIGGALIALLAVTLVWSSPVDPPESWFEAATDRLDTPIGAIESAWNELNRRLSPPAQGGDFAQFGESFEMGGELNLSDAPIVLLESDRPHYLAAQRYDIYTGRGWTSSAPDRIRAVNLDDEAIDAPLVAFQPGQEVPLSDAVMGARSNVNGTIQVLTPTGQLLFTIDTFGSSNSPVAATVSWRELENERFDLVNGRIDDLPAELRNLAILLNTATFVSVQGGFEASDPATNQRIEQEITNLQGRFLRVQVSVNSQGEAVAIYATGFVPNYDDIESLTASRGIGVGDIYRVSGWQSRADADQLRAAPVVYPDIVTQRYLGLPDSVTDETRALALSVAQGTDTVFDTALAIQEFLRASFPYEESISGPASGQDAVHYFLFEEQRGYCEYFASAMVVMLRSLDIPSRLVSGLMEVPYDVDEGGYLYRQKQAHTWVEVYFDGYGWIPFEPTPSRGAFDYNDDESRDENPPTPTPEPAIPTAEPEPTDAADEAEETPTAVAAITDDGNSGTPWRLGALIAGGLALAGSLFGLAWRMNRTTGGTAPGAANYRQLVRSARRYGVLPTVTTTPRELAARLGEVAPAVSAPADDVARLYRKEVYAGQALTPEERQLGERAMRRIHQIIRSERFRRTGKKASDGS
ncbi:MAG: DUF4129 domain-containing protein [Thermomicrobiales bacterium]|nr:DUF4129 domain-containing protein [Thermomicrobiales bacterium]